MTASKKAEVSKTEITKADKIWGMIKDIPLEMFALPEQTLETYATRLPITDDSVHMQLSASAALPALEAALTKVRLPKGEDWEVIQAGNYTIVKIVPKLV